MKFVGRSVLARAMGSAALSLLGLLGGCQALPLNLPRLGGGLASTVAHQPGPVVARPGAAVHGAPHHGAAPGAPGVGVPGGGPGNVVPAGGFPGSGTGSASILPLNLTAPESPQDVISALSQRLAANDDERKLLAARLAQIELLLQERERSLEDAREEIGATKVEVTRAQSEIRRARDQAEELRDKVRGREKEYKDLLEKFVRVMEERERGAAPMLPPTDPEK